MTYDYEAKARADFAAGAKDERLYAVTERHGEDYRRGWRLARLAAEKGPTQTAAKPAPPPSDAPPWFEEPPPRPADEPRAPAAPETPPPAPPPAPPSDPLRLSPIPSDLPVKARSRTVQDDQSQLTLFDADLLQQP